MKYADSIVEILARANTKVRGIRTEDSTQGTNKTKPRIHSGLSANHNRGHIRTTKLEREHLRHKRPLQPLYKKQQLLPIILPPTRITNILRPPLKYKQTYRPIKTPDYMDILPVFSRTRFASKALTTALSARHSTSREQ